MIFQDANSGSTRLSLARVWTTGQLVDERPDSPPVEGKEVPQLDDVDPALAGFALGYERLGPVQLPSDLGLRQARVFASAPQQPEELLVGT